ncbi:hypothetical protein C8J57DRAFT_1218470 [Mycena rebaudengoi]|nr:hypothetical protein C8J57DRAFT_1218470 [Mycena rebaudengoi]
MGSVHSDVTRKLCVEMVLVLRDMSIDILPSEEFSRSEAPFDYDGVDLLADAILVGISSWLREINPTEWALQPWYLCLLEVVHLLRGPISAALLPKSFSRATSNSFEKDIPTIYREVELDVMVETSIKTIPPRVPGFGLYYSEHVAGSEKKAAPSVPQENNSGVSFEDAKRTRQFNIVVLGSGGTGKTALTERFIHDIYAEEWDPTRARATSEFCIEQHHRQIMVDGEVSLLEVIDNAGSEYFSFGNEVYMKVAPILARLSHDRVLTHMVVC